MPFPKSGETKSDYIARFLDSEEAKKDFPDVKQRTAVAYSMFERKNAASIYGIQEKEIWPKSYKCNFIEPGVVHYQDLGYCKQCGPDRECVQGEGCEPTGETILVPQEALDRMAPTFVGKPVIDSEHKDVSPSTIPDGEAQGIVTRVWKEGGWDWCDFLVWDIPTQQHCDKGLFSVSCAYEPTKVDTTEGEYHNIPYASTIQDGFYTHLAIVQSPRYEGARILVNSKGDKMSWKFWEKGLRKNAAPLDPEKETVDLGNGKSASLKELYDALPDEPKKEEATKYNDDTMLSTPKGDKSLGELKKNFLEKQEKKNAEEAEKPCPTCGEKKNLGKPGEASSEAGEKENGEVVTPPLPDLRDKENADDEAAKKLEEEKKNADDATAAKAAEEKKNADDAAAAEKAAEDKKNADEKAEKEKELANAKKVAGKKSFADLKNARFDGLENSKIMPVAPEDRLARGKAKYGSA